MTAKHDRYHAHIYYDPDERVAARRLQQAFSSTIRKPGPGRVLFVGELRDRSVGPHPKPQFEIHFLEASLPAVLHEIEASGLRALVHPLTEDDLADHTTLARWIGEPLTLDHSVLDPPGANQGLPRFGKSDF